MWEEGGGGKGLSVGALETHGPRVLMLPPITNRIDKSRKLSAGLVYLFPEGEDRTSFMAVQS